MSTGLRFTLEVDGLPPDAFAVVSFHLNQSLSSLFSLDLSLVSQQFLSLEFAQVLDKMAYLTIWQGDEVQRRVKGVVTWFELGENDKNQMLYSMKVHPPLWRAGLRQNFRIFQNEDIKSILGTMLQENGVAQLFRKTFTPYPFNILFKRRGQRHRHRDFHHINGVTVFPGHTLHNMPPAVFQLLNKRAGNTTVTHHKHTAATFQG